MSSAPRTGDVTWVVIFTSAVAVFCKYSSMNSPKLELTRQREHIECESRPGLGFAFSLSPFAGSKWWSGLIWTDLD
jgi:hypothetical protein